MCKVVLPFCSRLAGRKIETTFNIMDVKGEWGPVGWPGELEEEVVEVEVEVEVVVCEGQAPS